MRVTFQEEQYVGGVPRTIGVFGDGELRSTKGLSDGQGNNSGIITGDFRGIGIHLSVKGIGSR